MRRALALPLLFIAIPAVSAAETQLASNVRIMEDTIWLLVFCIMMLAAYQLMKLTTGGLKGLSTGYAFLLAAGVSGFLWKGIGLLKRIMGASDPAWFFNVLRESFEGLTGLLFGIAFVILLYAVTRK